MKLRQAKSLSLRGMININGRQSQFLVGKRDGCVLHLHEETGGVFVTYEGQPHDPSVSSHYIPPMAIESVDLSEPVQQTSSVSPMVAQAELDEKMNASARQQTVDKAAKNLADEVLAEFQEKDAVPHPKRKRIGTLGRN